MSADLRSWISIWHPRYRPFLVQLLVIASVVGGLVYLENTLLHGLVGSLTGEVPTGDEADRIVSVLERIAGAAGLPFAFLGAIFVVGMLRALLGARRDVVGARMGIKSRDELEQQVLYHLLHREDEFFSEHSTGEIMNRLEVDLYRILDRRETLADMWWAALMIIANLIFFGLADWRLALVVVAICVVGTLFTEYVSKPVKRADARYFQSNDQVKMEFEDYLKAIPEIQVGGLYGPILQRFRRPQGGRLDAFMAWIFAYTKVQFSRSAWPVIAFLISVLIVLFAHRGADADSAESLALIPVLIFALPSIFASVTSLVTLRIGYQLAGNSIERILEYEKAGLRSRASAEPLDAEPSAEPVPSVEVDGATYQYPAPEGGLQGGISDVVTSFGAGKWSAIVGGAGSGKSTLVNLVLGRLAPQQGCVRFGGRALPPDDGEYLASIATLMPQRVVLFDATIRDNLLLGRRRGFDERAFTDEDLTTLERLGLGAICRLKGLEMRPVDTERGLDEEALLELRVLARARAREIHVALAPFEVGHVDPARPVVDALLGGRTEGDGVITALLAGERPAWLQRIDHSPLADELITRARTVIEQSRNLLELPSYGEFASLSADPIDDRVWSLRRDCLRTLDRRAKTGRERLKLLRVALTCAPAEWGATQQSADDMVAVLRKRHGPLIEELRAAVADSWQPFERERIHPYLCWRDNLLFGVADLANQRRRRKLDAMLLELMSSERWSAFFVSQGLEFGVGRNGARLSGGQGQLVSLARAVLRRTPVLVLDEPTSALDPASRDRVAAFLREWRSGRIVITISHDPELTRNADEIHVINAGRFAARGSFDELAQTSEVFKEIFRLE